MRATPATPSTKNGTNAGQKQLDRTRNHVYVFRVKASPDLGGVPPNAEQCKELFKMMPEAFLFTYAGSDKSATKLNYGPNPNLQPPSREARVISYKAKWG